MWHLPVWLPADSEIHSPAGWNIVKMNWCGRIVTNDNLKHTFIQLVTLNCLFKFPGRVIRHPGHWSLNCLSQKQVDLKIIKINRNCLQGKQLPVLSGALEQQFNPRGRK